MRLEGIDALRGFAVLLVIIYHFYVLLDLDHLCCYNNIHLFGLFGVSLFFIISGYLIYHSATSNFRQYGFKLGIKHFFSHRIFRIIPAYYFNLFVVLMLVALTIDYTYFYSAAFLRQILTHLTFSSFLIYKTAGFEINGAYWTLNIEMLWYVLVPVIILFIQKTYYFVLIAILSFCYLIMLDIGVFDTWFNLDENDNNYEMQLYYYSFQIQGQISYFISGILIYKFGKNFLTLTSKQKYFFSFILISLFIYISSYHITSHSSLFFINLFMLFIASSLFILLYNTRSKGVKWLEWFGKISYSLYLWHMPLLYIMNQSSILQHQNFFNVLLIFIISLLLISSFSYYFIEESGFKLRKKFEKYLK